MDQRPIATRNPLLFPLFTCIYKKCKRSVEMMLNICSLRAGRQLDMSKERRGTGQMAGNHISSEHRGSLGKQRKAGTSRLTGNHIFWGDVSWRQRKVRKGGNLQCPNVTFCSICPHYNKISLADKKFPSCTNAMTLRIKAK